MRVQICTLSSEDAPHFSANLSVNVHCPSCGQEFREPASLLEHSLQSSVTGKFRIAPRR
jgi:hypothetical protein